jgi:GH25 family lysozyme M1 (1,4-beta-N-acetylmuramidase)
MTVPQFVDLSAFQPTTIDWAAYRTWAAQWDGVARVAMRSSYGVGYIDQHFAGYRASALTAGIDVILFYHYSYPQFNSRASDEANWQRQVVGSIREQDMMILDYEENVGQATSDWAYVWLQTQEANYGKPPGIYASSSYIQQRLQHDGRLTRYPLWLANWQFSPDARPACPPPWSKYEFVQYTDKATGIPGIPGAVDANIFLGGSTPIVQIYTPGKGDFATYFVDNGTGSWTCKQTNMVLMGGNLTLYQKLSIDGNSLPILGLPRTNELYQHDPDGYGWSVQFFERGLIVFDSQHKKDSQPGMGSSYLGKYEQFKQYDPA